MSLSGWVQSFRGSKRMAFVDIFDGRDEHSLVIDKREVTVVPGTLVCGMCISVRGEFVMLRMMYRSPFKPMYFLTTLQRQCLSVERDHVS